MRGRPGWLTSRCPHSICLRERSKKTHVRLNSRLEKCVYFVICIEYPWYLVSLAQKTEKHVWTEPLFMFVTCWLLQGESWYNKRRWRSLTILSLEVNLKGPFFREMHVLTCSSRKTNIFSKAFQGFLILCLITFQECLGVVIIFCYWGVYAGDQEIVHFRSFPLCLFPLQKQFCPFAVWRVGFFHRVSLIFSFLFFSI